MEQPKPLVIPSAADGGGVIERKLTLRQNGKLLAEKRLQLALQPRCRDLVLADEQGCALRFLQQ